MLLADPNVPAKKEMIASPMPKSGKPGYERVGRRLAWLGKADYTLLVGLGVCFGP